MSSSSILLSPEQLIAQQGLREIPTCLANDPDVQIMHSYLERLFRRFPALNTSDNPDETEEHQAKTTKKTRKFNNAIRREIAPAALLAAFLLLNKAYDIYEVNKEEKAAGHYCVAIQAVIKAFRADNAVKALLQPFTNDLDEYLGVKVPCKTMSLPELRAALVTNEVGFDFDFDFKNKWEDSYALAEALDLAVIHWEVVRRFVTWKESSEGKDNPFALIKSAQIDKHLQTIREIRRPKEP